MAVPAKARHQAAVALIALVAGCSNNPPIPEWQQNAFDSMQVFQQLYLSGDTAGAESEFKRARFELTATGRADLVARAELIRCAAQVASLAFEPCKGFEVLQQDARAEERAYAAYLEGRGPHSASNEPFSQLVAYGVQMRTTSINPQGIANAVEISSSQGWRRPLLAWLGVQLKRAEQAGDSETAARLKRRIELVSG
jgi:hypothetical protein